MNDLSSHLKIITLHFNVGGPHLGKFSSIISSIILKITISIIPQMEALEHVNHKL